VKRVVRVVLVLLLGALLLREGTRIFLLAASPLPSVAIPPAPRPTATPGGTTKDADAGKTEGYQEIAARNLFHPERKLVTEEPTPAILPPAARSARGEPIVLYGVLFEGGNPKAIVKAGQRTDIRSVRPGDEVVPGVRVKAITLGGMTLVEDGIERTIRIMGASSGGGQGDALSSPPQMAQPPRPPVARPTPRIPRTIRPGIRPTPLIGPPSTLDFEIIEEQSDEAQ
jgi:hypothetical protein